MKQFLLIILLFIGVGYASGQKKFVWKEPTEKDLRIAEKNNLCIKANKFTLSQRLLNHPFNIAASVILISFTNDMVLTSQIPVRNHRLEDRTVIDNVILSPVQIDSLTNLLYNVGPTPNDYWFKLGDTGMKCYEPHNGILFIDRDGYVKEYIEICFDCHRMKFSSRKIKVGDFCTQKYEMLKHFFMSAGVQYLTSRKE